ncbi:lycopene cyclase family protein [Streptomyces sp. NPDC001389]|uniref:lycopene cyclase family protein n=1 Tax=unclassified Streptomyces TaxID=2593676 RepID=UPI0036951305
MADAAPAARAAAEVVIVGGGAAGLSLAHRLARAGITDVAVVEPPQGPLRPPERTWCHWAEGSGEYDGAISASWERLRVRGPDGSTVVSDPSPMTYRMIRSGALEELVHRGLADHAQARLVRGAVHEIRDRPGGAEVRCDLADGGRLELRGRYVFDSRPLPALPPARTVLLQHFRGWFVRTASARFDPRVADLMDFRVPQPRHGVAFGYVLPLAPDHALVEYTEFSRAPLTSAGYEAALRHYAGRVLRLGPYAVLSDEQGVIPMTDARFPRRVGPSVYRIGAAGGATRPATGYTFSALQRQSRDIAAALRTGRREIVPPPHGRRALAMDAVLLRGIDAGRIDGAAFFTHLFRTVPGERLLRFLDGQTTPREEFGIGLRTPVAPMLRTAAELPFLRRRTRPRAMAAPQPEENAR